MGGITERAAVAVVALAIGCASEDLCAQYAEPVPPAPEGSSHAYVISDLRFPANATEAAGFGLDLDGDPDGQADNSLGQFLSVFNIADYNLGADVRDRLRNGEMIHLLELTATSLIDAEAVGVSIHQGIDLDGNASDNWSGDEPFALDGTTARGQLYGRIEGRTIDVGLGTLPLALVVLGIESPVLIDLQAARILASIGPGEFGGQLAGAVSEAEVNRTLIPAMHTGLSVYFESECGNPPYAVASRCQLYLDLWDEDDSGSVSLAELRDSALTQSLLAPDLDMFDDHLGGALHPNCDGNKDSLGLGLGFTAETARIER